MPSDNGLLRLRTDNSGIIVNEADDIGDDLEPMPALFESRGTKA
jgi:hypothetical protein